MESTPGKSFLNPQYTIEIVLGSIRELDEVLVNSELGSLEYYFLGHELEDLSAHLLEVFKYLDQTAAKENRDLKITEKIIIESCFIRFINKEEVKIKDIETFIERIVNSSTLRTEISSLLIQLGHKRILELKALEN